MTSLCGIALSVSPSSGVALHDGGRPLQGSEGSLRTGVVLHEDVGHCGAVQ